MANEKQNLKPKADSEQSKQKKEEQARTTRRRTRQLIGLALSVLIVVGAVSIVMRGVEMVTGFFDNSGEKETYLKLYEPMVWFQILPFDSVSQLDENSIKQVAIWGVLNTMSQQEIPRSERGEPMVSAAEVEAYAAQMFGPDFRFSGHATFSDPLQGMTYVFDEDTQMYIAPPTSLMPQYLATVVEIKREAGGVRRLVMGYVATTTSDNQLVATPDYEHPVRYMDFLLRRDGNAYYLYAIENNTTHPVTQPGVSSASETALSPLIPAESITDSSVPPDSVPPDGSVGGENADAGSESTSASSASGVDSSASDSTDNAA